MTIAGSLIINILTKTSTGGLDKTDRAIRKTTSSLKKMSESTGLIGKLSQSMFRGFNFGSIRDGFMNYLQFEKDLGAIHSRFYAITKDEQKAKQEFKFIQDVANETATDVKSMADSYSIFFSATSKSLGTQGAKEVFTDWAKVGRVLHLSEYQMERVTYALREMSSKGAIYSQDLRMQIGTHVPNAMGLAQQAAEEMGIKGTQWFETLQKKAKGNAKVTADFVRLFSKYAKQAYGTPEALKKAMQQPDALAQMIANKKFEFGYKFSQAGGGYMIVKILEGVNKLIAKIDFDKITTVLGRIAHLVGDMTNHIKLIAKILAGIAIFKVGVNIWTFLREITFLRKMLRMFPASRQAGMLGGLIKSGQMSKWWTPILETMIKALGKGGLKLGLGSIITNAIKQAFLIFGPIGIIIDAILILPEIVKLIRFISRIIALKYETKNWVKQQLWSQGLSYKGLIDAFNVIKNTKIKNKTQLENVLEKQGMLNYSKFFNFDAQNNIKVYINDIPIDMNKIQGESENTIKDNKNGIFHRIKQALIPKPMQSPDQSYFDKL